jgi:hypothetical protein
MNPAAQLPNYFDLPGMWGIRKNDDLIKKDQVILI